MARGFSRRRFVKGTAAATLGVAAGFSVPTIVKAAAADKWGDLTARFVYEGKAPPRKKLTVDKDLECCGKFDIREESLMVGEDRGLANVYLYVRSRGVAVCPELEERVEKRVLLDNRDCIFIPHCTKIWCAKQEYHIVNSDPVSQNVTFTLLKGRTSASIVLPPAPKEGWKATWRFPCEETLPVQIKCSYHPWEEAYVLPRENPYVDISRMDGSLRISKLPVGQWEFQVWHEMVGYLDTPAWKKGRFKMTIMPGVNDLGTIKLARALFVRA